MRKIMGRKEFTKDKNVIVYVRVYSLGQKYEAPIVFSFI